MNSLTHTNSKHLAGLQVVRALAALLVLFHHLGEEFAQFLPTHPIVSKLVLFGAFGVDLFFVLSGFIIGYSFKESPFSSRAYTALDFLKRRFIRVAPLYWFVLLVTLCLWITGYFYKSEHWTPSDILWNFSMLPYSNLIVGVGWTLTFEVLFYLLFAVAAFFKPSNPSKLSLLFIVALSISVPANDFTPGWANIISPMFLEFGFGIMILMIYRAINDKEQDKLPWALAIIGLVGALVGTIYAPSNGTTGLTPEARWFAWGIPAACILISFLYWRAPSRWLQYFGEFSYSLYLTHGFVMVGLAFIIKREAMSTSAALLLAAFGVVASLALAHLTHRLIELPISNWLTRNTKRAPNNNTELQNNTV